MEKCIEEYALSLHGCSEDTKENYIETVKWFGAFLKEYGKNRFEDATAKDIGLFLSKYSISTRNLHIHNFRRFYNYINKPEIIKDLKLYKLRSKPIPYSQCLTLEEVVAIAEEAGKKREEYKVLTLTLFESCARISEILSLKVGDVEFSSVADKDGKRTVIATLYFERSKGNVNKQPVTLIMFASELKRWIANHPCKGDKTAYLFLSPYDPTQPVSDVNIFTVLQNAGRR